MTAQLHQISDQEWLKWPCWSIRLGIVVGCVLAAISIWHYPGGNHFEPKQPGYDMLRNYICDNFDPYTRSGARNSPGDMYAYAALLTFTWFSLFPMWAFLSQAGIKTAWLGWLVGFIGFASAVGASILPLSYMFNWHLSHATLVLTATVPSFVATMCFCSLAYWGGGFSRLSNWIGAVLIASFIASLVIWAIHVWGEQPAFLISPAMAKVTTFLLMGWLFSLTLQFRPRKRNALS